MKCEYDWYQLVPAETAGALEGFECRCYKYRDYPEYEPPEFLPLPLILDARAQLLAVGCHLREMLRIIEPSFSPVLQLADLDEPDKLRFGTFQPMMFSLVTVLEAPLQKLIPYELRAEDECEDGRRKVRAAPCDPRLRLRRGELLLGLWLGV